MSAPISQLVPTPLQAVAMSDSAPLILHVFPTFAVGGAQLRFVAVANRLGRAWRHAVVALDGNTACGARLDPALDVSFPQVRLEKGNILGNMRRNRAFLRDLRPALLVTSNWGAMEWALANRWRQLPHIHTEDGFGPDEATRQLPRRVWARRLGLRRATVVVPSRRLWTIATQRWRLAPARVHYIPNGVDLTGFAVTHLARQNGDEPVIGAVAALRPEKNLARLLRAFHQVVRAGDVRGRLVVVGDGAERARLEACAVCRLYGGSAAVLCAVRPSGAAL
jgi:glycosyltransferase involved in cell wall biosynthesis